MIPRATYRLQFHKGFTFADAARQADYLASLGVSHVYASPILTARAGSLHGYDVVDHSRINPELGGEEGLQALSRALTARGLGMILDIVPNHMAVGQADNRWWLDVLANGRASVHAGAFDIDWDAPGLDGKLLAPFLDGQPEDLWQKGDLQLIQEEGRWAFAYFGHRFPLRPDDRNRPMAPTTWAEAREILDRQHFRLADWREADANINWRRFFDITELAALRMENPTTFEAVHEKIFALYANGVIEGVRVDHVDGLADPAAYCRALRTRLSALRPDPYILVEKILADGETLPAEWQVDGTTGYEFMNDITALLHADDGGELERLWHAASGRTLPFDAEDDLARDEILTSKFVAQFNATLRAFGPLLPKVRPETLRHTMTRVIQNLRCYRGYATGLADSPGPGPLLSRALAQAPFLKAFFDRRDNDPVAADALRRFHQLTAPVAAKAVEDTAFYRYGRLLSRNDVGFDPRRTFLAPEEFHARISARAKSHPHAMLTTATHDHKRGEDTRARLAALSAHTGIWRRFVEQAPDPGPVHPADAYFLHQTLFGAWPANPGEGFSERVETWCRKYLREAKLRSSWQSPDTAYEDAFCAFARRLIRQDGDYRGCMEALLEAITPAAQDNSLAQVILRYCLPGVPDLYQGCEFTDLSLVDPDNRRPVNYAARVKVLAAPSAAEVSFDHRKQRLIALLLAARQRNATLWRFGRYEPVPAPDGMICFRRPYEAQSLLVLVRCNGRSHPDPIPLPAPGYNLLTGRQVAKGSLTPGTGPDGWPGAVLLCTETSG